MSKKAFKSSKKAGSSNDTINTEDNKDNSSSENNGEGVLIPEAKVAGKDKEGGTSSGKPNQVHHFASNKSSKYTSQFENIANKYNLDLDDAWNKELMPHQGRHPYAYHDYVLDNMQKFDKIAQGDTSKFLKLYEQMKQKIIDNPDMLYKDYWKTK